MSELTKRIQGLNHRFKETINESNEVNEWYDLVDTHTDEYVEGYQQAQEDLTRVWLRRGESAPKGVRINKGTRGGTYYESDENKHFKVPKSSTDIRPYITTRLKNHPKLEEAISDAMSDYLDSSPKKASTEAIRRARGLEASPTKGPEDRERKKKESEDQSSKRKVYDDYRSEVKARQGEIDSWKESAKEKFKFETLPEYGDIPDELKQMISDNPKLLTHPNQIMSNGGDTWMKMRNTLTSMPKDQFTKLTKDVRTSFGNIGKKLDELKRDELNPETHNLQHLERMYHALSGMVGYSEGFRSD